MSSNKTLSLPRLRSGLPGVSPIRASEHYEACVVCLSDEKHTPGVELEVDGDFSENFSLIWDKSDLTEQIRLSWEDEQEATESGACCIAFLVVLALTDYTVIKRSVRGTGFDYWLGDKSDTLPIQAKACLEISGIRHAQRNSDLKARIREKIEQTRSLKDHDLPTYIVVVDFGQPRVYVVMI